MANGNFVVSNPLWLDLNREGFFGATTFFNGETGTTGVISASNSLIGSSECNFIGNNLTPLTNGNYVIGSECSFANKEYAQVVVFADGKTGIKGVVSESNSLTIPTGEYGLGATVKPLANGNYIIGNQSWDNGEIKNVGIVTLVNGNTGRTGVISASDSLIGSSENDYIGNSITALSNGNYVITSSAWSNGNKENVGAMTFGDGTTGITGEISESNSLVGSTANERFGLYCRITELANENYVISSTSWSNGEIKSVGAVTFVNGTTGITGMVSELNSIIGSLENDHIGGSITALTNGNYVIGSSGWSNGIEENVGAVTLVNGTTAITGRISESNSLVGSSANDRVGEVRALTNGNYIVTSPNWDKDGRQDVGAATFANGVTGITGEISEANSLIGSKEYDRVGKDIVTPLPNGNYVVASKNWDKRGAVTFGDGKSGINGLINPLNSLVGSSIGDQVGDAFALPDGNYVVISTSWDNGDIKNVGAVSYLSGVTGNFRPNAHGNPKITKAFKEKNNDPSSFAIGDYNSVIGTIENGGYSMNHSFDTANNQLVIGRPSESIVTFFKFPDQVAVLTKVSGRVLTASGRGIPRAIVSITNSDGEILRAITNQFGYYYIDDVEVAKTYEFNVQAKGHSFATQMIDINEELRNLIFTAQ